ncbi:twin-arginine translocase TatA/TatE family subunit [Pararhodospirillum photometricum]|uniref:Sec-independent protein translocase protein TatA n=1 Tax=Pararhodospirillum photometricum DSM 122 TaxID=1150469 RepID=H6SII7_PARPM|nr:twin-arginine translocase TatA/TatE family subunit [Pararhodospirillum photometricum]CCG06753.1 Bacterial sec-independent translocation protein mttA/Hcf106 [Pararhodospirillum photometricum DSM 122]
MGTFSIWHWIIVLIVVLLLFGAGKIPRLMGDVAKGVKAFKKGLQDEDTSAEATRPADPAPGAQPSLRKDEPPRS